jgi:O-antigen/teichoic acid export membrane protein
MSHDSGNRRAGERAVANTALLATGEIVGKLASLLLFAVLARQVGPSDLGHFLFAFAWAQLAMTPVGLGMDRYLLRRIAADHDALGEMLWGALALKLSRSLVVVVVSVVAINLLDYDASTRMAVYVLTFGLLLETLAHTLMHAFGAFERGGLTAAGVVTQRVMAAVLGLVALALGYGIVAVSVAYAIGAAGELAVSWLGMSRRIGLPRPAFPRSARKELRSRAAPFAAEDIFGLLLARLDVVILSFLASGAVVGIYGSAYRLLEATSFIPYSLSGAFAAQYTYLDNHTTPTVRTVFERSLKLSLALLVPCAVAYGTLAEPLCRLFFGAKLVAAAEPLRLLAPVVVLYGLVVLSSSLVVSRRNPRTIAVVIGGIVVLNVVLNFALIPSFDANGAATAMLVSDLAFAGVALGIANRTVGGVSAARTIASPAVAGAVMAAVTLLLQATLIPALAAGALAYLAAYILVERRVSPDDLRYARRLVRRRAATR